MRVAIEVFLEVAAGSGLAASPDHARDAHGDGHHTRVCRAQQGSAPPRLDVCRSDDDLRVHAGNGPGERSRRGLRLQRSDSWIDCRTRWKASSYTFASFCGDTPIRNSTRPSASWVVVSETFSRWPVTSDTLARFVRNALRPLMRSRV